MATLGFIYVPFAWWGLVCLCLMTSLIMRDSFDKFVTEVLFGSGICHFYNVDFLDVMYVSGLCESAFKVRSPRKMKWGSYDRTSVGPSDLLHGGYVKVTRQLSIVTQRWLRDLSVQ